MMEILINFLAAFAKVFTVASAMDLPLENCKKFIFSSEPILVLMLFCFVVGETKSVIPALLVTIVYLYVQVLPRKLKIKDAYFQDYEKA